MSDGRPISPFEFSQEQEEEQEPTIPVEMEQTPPENPVDRGEVRMQNSLLSDGHWAEEPYTADQESRFPTSVRTHAVVFRLFNVTDTKDMADYSKIFLSDEKRGRFVFAGPEGLQWDLPNARCFILVRVAERRFLSLSTAHSNPNTD